MSDERLSAIETRLNAIEKQIAVEAVVGDGIEKRLDKIEGTLTWLVRLIIGAIVLALIGFVINGGTAV